MVTLWVLPSAGALLQCLKAEKPAHDMEEVPAFPGFPSPPAHDCDVARLCLSSSLATPNTVTSLNHVDASPPTAGLVPAAPVHCENSWVLQAASGVNPTLPSGFSELLKAAGLHIPAGMKICIQPQSAHPQALSTWPPRSLPRSRDMLGDVIALDGMSLKLRAAGTSQGMQVSLPTVAVLQLGRASQPCALQGPHNPCPLVGPSTAKSMAESKLGLWQGDSAHAPSSNPHAAPCSIRSKPGRANSTGLQPSTGTSGAPSFAGKWATSAPASDVHSISPPGRASQQQGVQQNSQPGFNLAVLMSTLEHDSDASSLDFEPPQDDEGGLQHDFLDDIQATSTSLQACGDPDSQDDMLDTEVTLRGGFREDREPFRGENLADFSLLLLIEPTVLMVSCICCQLQEGKMHAFALLDGIREHWYLCCFWQVQCH